MRPTIKSLQAEIVALRKQIAALQFVIEIKPYYETRYTIGAPVPRSVGAVSPRPPERDIVGLQPWDQRRDG